MTPGSARAHAFFALGAIVLACSIELAPLGTAGGTDGGGSGGKIDASAGSGGIAIGGTGASSASGGSGGSAGGGGSAGSQGADAGTPCWHYCEHAVQAACNSDTISQCAADCEYGLSNNPRCAAQYQAWTDCGASGGTFTCTGGEAQITNCTAEVQAFDDCTWNLHPICNVPGSPPSGGGCYSSSGCNPFVGCGAQQTCDWTDDATKGYYALVCWPPDPVVQSICQPCTQNGPFCAGGLSCVGGTCVSYCCTDADCGGAPGSCTPWGDTALRFCST